jgi:hypothetical protein
MNELFGMFNDMGELAAELIRVVGGQTIRAIRIVMRRLRTAARLAFIWPFVLLLAAMPGYKFAQYAVPIATIVPLLIFLWLITGLGPLSVLVGEVAFSKSNRLLGKFVAEARRATNIIRFILGLELVAGIILSLVPVANDRRLAFLLVPIVAAIFCFVETSKKTVRALVALGCVIMLICCLGGRKNLHLKNVFAQSNGNQTDKAFQGKPSAARPAYTGNPLHTEQPLATARPTTDPQEKHLLALSPRIEIMPMSGDEGTFRIRMYAAKYIASDEIDCEGYIQNNKDGSENPLVYIGDSAGVDDRGVGFNVWDSNGSIQFLRGGNARKLIPGSKNGFVFRFRRTSGATKLAFTLNVIGEDARSHAYSFQNIPVDIN